MNPDTIPLTFFRKSSGSISGPNDDVIRPAHVRFLDYEVEIGLVIGRDMPVGTADHRTTTSPIYVAGAGGHQRHLRARRPAAQDPVLRGQVLPDVHPGRPRAGPAGRRRTQAVHRPASAAAGSTASLRQDMTVADMIYRPVAGAAGADPVPAPRCRRLLLTGTPVGTALERPTEARRDPRLAATARSQVEAVLPRARPATRTTCTTATSSRPPSPPTTAPSTSAASAPSCGGPDDRRTDDRPMTDDLLWPRYAAPSDLAAIEAVPLAATRPPRLHLCAAHPRRNPVAGPHRDHRPPGRRAVARAAAAQLRRAAGRRAPLRQPAPPARRAARRRGRPDGAQLRRTDHRDAGRPAGRDRRAAQRRSVAAAHRRAAPPLRRPGDRHRRAGARPSDLGRSPGPGRRRDRWTRCWCCGPPARTARRRTLPAVDGVLVGYLDELSAGIDPSDFDGEPPRANDLAALFHTGGTTGAPKLAAHTHANQVTDAWMLAANSPARARTPWCSPRCRCSTSTPWWSPCSRRCSRGSPWCGPARSATANPRCSPSSGRSSSTTASPR